MRPPGNGARWAAGTKEDFSLNNNSNRNNNNNNNNRRRGRGNRNQGGGGGQQQNRIDSRARGNAPQMLDKYKKLAQDAQHNGDRVQAEYYLQFADHYFRVIADNKARQDEGRGRRDERDFDDDDSSDMNGDDTAETRADRGDRNDRNDRSERSNDDRGRDDRNQSGQRNARRPRARRDEQDTPSRGAEGEAFTPDENPFARDDRDDRDDRPVRAERAPRAERAERAPRAERSDDGEQAERRPARRRAAPRVDSDVTTEAPAAFDAAVLPPSISVAAASGDGDAAPKAGLKPRRRRAAGDAEDTVAVADS